MVNADCDSHKSVSGPDSAHTPVEHTFGSWTRRATDYKIACCLALYPVFSCWQSYLICWKTRLCFSHPGESASMDLWGMTMDDREAKRGTGW